MAVGIALVIAVPLTASAAPTPAPAPSTGSSSTGSSSAGSASSNTTITGGSTYLGNPKSEALLTEAESTRLVSVRSIVNQADITGASAAGPYRLVTGSTYTLVLPARVAPYTFRDLQSLEPSTLVRQPDGSYLLGEDIVVDLAPVGDSPP